MYMRIRAAGIIIDNGRVLLVEHRKNGRSYWLLPGGGIRTGETIQAALKRELFEEIHVHVVVSKLLFVVETISQQGVHIIQPTYAMQANIESPAIGGDRRVVGFKYFDETDLQDVIIYPDIKAEIQVYLHSGKFSKRYFFKQWVD